MIIKSILDTDLYKFTTSYAYMKLFPQAVGTFEFKDRDNTEYTEEFVEQLRIELYNLAQVRLTSDEFEFMNSIRFIPRHYWEWLSQFTFNPSKVQIFLDEEKHLHIIAKDYLYKVSLYEVPIPVMLNKLESKIKRSNQSGIYFSEFETRRRFSYNIQEEVIKYIKEKSIYCTGTSNCYFAMKYDMKPMGTHPHEWFMFHGAMYSYKQANYMALKNWVNVYDGDLGIALTDTYTSNVFIKNFSRKQAKLFDGVRCDSGDEYEFVNKMIARYKELGIDPTTKIIIFSNALDFEKAEDIALYCMTRIRASFGIGTNLTNDTGFKPSNIVMKLTSCQMNSNQPVYDCVKLSDDEGKHTGRAMEVNSCLAELGL